MKKFILNNFNIDFTIFKYHIKGYGWKYFLEIRSIKEIRRFGEIGFALESHQKRLDTTIDNIKLKAWEITLKNILNINNKYFRIKDVNRLFFHLCKRAVHHRLSDLVKMNYLSIDKKGYFLTKKGIEKSKLLSNVKNSKLRTNPRKNEDLIFKLINEKSIIWRNEISRTLSIHAVTVGDVLKRLSNQNRIKSY